MSEVVISIENLSKTYQLGAIGTGTFYGDLKRWWARQRGLPDPYQKIGEKNHHNKIGETIWALRDINFTVSRGQAVGIVGRNGAGKSTLLKILSQVTAPTKGVVKAKGRIASLLEVGTGFHSELTGRENIFLNGAIMGMSRAEVRRKFDEIVDFSGVEKFIDTPVKRYSSGMYVRLAFAVAAHLEPEILVVGEVLAGGDAEFQKKCLGKMDDVAHKEGRTVLFVSHNMSTVAQLCNWGIFLRDGQVANIGDIETIIQAYTQVVTENNQTEVFFLPREDSVVSFTRFSMQGSSGETKRVFSSGEEFYFVIDYEVKEPLLRDYFSLLISRADGLVVLKAAEDDYGRKVPEGKKPGRYQVKIRFPGNVLNEGVYKFRVAFGKRRGVFHEDRHGFSFEIEDWNDYTNSSFGKRNGVLLFPLDWSEEKVGEYSPQHAASE